MVRGKTAAIGEHYEFGSQAPFDMVSKHSGVVNFYRLLPRR